MNRCSWINLKNSLYIDYHDHEYGHINHDDDYLLEMLILECFTSGLSFEIILNKRENFRNAYDNFNINKIIKYDDEKIKELLDNKGIIRSKSKIEASINNAKIFKQIQDEYGSFNNYIWSHVDKRICETGKVRNELSDLISKELKSYGMKYVGTITMYSYLSAIGVINSHDVTCDLSGK